MRHYVRLFPSAAIARKATTPVVVTPPPVILPDTVPAAFTFIDVVNVALGSAQVSNTITVSGIDSPAPVTVSGGVYYKNGGLAQATATTALAGDTFAVGHSASSSNLGAVSTTLTIGGVSDTFTSTTLAAVGGATLDTGITAPDFTFTSVTGDPPELNFVLDETAVVDDNLVIRIATDRVFTTPTLFIVPLTAANIAGTSPIFIPAGLTAAVLNAKPYVGARIEHGSTTYSNWSATRKYGDTTAPAVTTASSGTFAEQTAIADSWSTTEYVTVSLTGADAALVESTVTGGTSGAFRLLANALPDYPTKASYSFNAIFTDDAGNITTVAKTWTISSLDRTPNAFTFTDVSGANQSTLYTSNSITVTGVDAALTNIAASVTNAQYQITRGGTPLGWQSAGSFTTRLNDQIQLRLTSGAYSTATNAVLTVGTVSDTYTVSVMADPTGVSFTPSTTQVGEVASGFVATYTVSVDFIAGLALVYFFQGTGNCTSVTGVTIGGVAATKLAGSANGLEAVWAATLATGGSKSVVVSGTGGVFGNIELVSGTAVGAQTIPSATSYDATGFSNVPFTGSSLTVLSQGLGVFFVYDGAGGGAGTVTGASTVASAGPMKIATSPTTTTPGITGGANGSHGIIGIALQK